VFPAHAVIVSASHPARGNPFWLKPGLCSGAELDRYNRETAVAQESDPFWVGEVGQLAAKVASLTGHYLPKDVAEYRPFLSSIVDCTLCHACLGLDDAPRALLNDEGAPDELGLFGRLDRVETAGVLWPFTYFRRLGEGAFLRYARLAFGYYFVVLADRMQAAVDRISRNEHEKVGASPAIFIQVMSDVNISPQLAMLGLEEAASVRPQWLATLITELWVRGSGSSAEFSVRVLYSGKIQRPCPGQRGALCPWSAFRALLLKFAPDAGSCPQFYDNYDLVSSLKSEVPSPEASS